MKPEATSPEMTCSNRSPKSSIKYITADERAWDLVRNYVTSWLVIKRPGRTEEDEEEEGSRRGPMPCRRQNKMPWADLMNGERLWQQSSRKFSFVLKEENSLKVGLPLWTWYYKKRQKRLCISEIAGVSHIVLWGHRVWLHLRMCQLSAFSLSLLGL